MVSRNYNLWAVSPLLVLALGREEIGPGFCLICASVFSMEVGRLTLRCGLFVLKYRCGRRADGSVLGLGLMAQMLCRPGLFLDGNRLLW